MYAYHSPAQPTMSSPISHLVAAIRGRTAARVLAGILALAGATASDAYGDTVRIPLPQDPGTLTPLTFTIGYPVLTLVYDTITWRDARGVPRPWLARSVRATEEGRLIVVRLRRGLRWHDGRPLTASDVAFTYDFMRARRHPRYASQLRAIQSVRAVGRRTVEFRLRHPSIGFADQPLADVPILPAHVWRGLGPGLRAPDGDPVGSGPYRYAGRSANGALRLAAVSGYFRGRPRADTVEVPVVPQLSEMIAELRRGTVDTLPFSLTPQQRASLESVSIRVADGADYLGTMLLFNVRSGPFTRAGVRRAVARALDVPRIARAAGRSMPASTGFLHPNSRWAPEPEDPAPLPAARSLAGLGLAPLRVLAPANDLVRREAGRQVVLALRRAGADARLVTLSREALSAAVGEGGRRARFEVAVWSIPPLVSQDPDYLTALFGARGPLNRAGYRSAEFDRLAGRVAAAGSVPTRRAAVGALLERLADDAPAIPLMFAGGSFAYRSTSPVGWTYSAGAGILDKQSLLRSARARPAAAAAPPSAAAEDDGSGPGLFGVLAAGMLALALLLGGMAALARRR